MLVRLPVMFSVLPPPLPFRSVARVPLLMTSPVMFNVLPFSASSVPEFDTPLPTVAMSPGPLSPKFPLLVRVPVMLMVLPPPNNMKLVPSLPVFEKSPVTLSLLLFSRSICPAFDEPAPAEIVLPPVKEMKPVVPTFNAFVMVRVCGRPISVIPEVVPLLTPPNVSELILVLPRSRVTRSLLPE